MFKFWELTAEWNVLGCIGVPAFFSTLSAALFVTAGYGPMQAVPAGMVMGVVYVVAWNAVAILSARRIPIAGITLNALGVVLGGFIARMLLSAKVPFPTGPSMNLLTGVSAFIFIALGVYVVLYASAMYNQTQAVLRKAIEEHEKYESMNAAGTDKGEKDGTKDN